MKKLLLLLLVVISIPVFGQDLQEKYNSYLEKANTYIKSSGSTDKPMSYNEWLTSMGIKPDIGTTLRYTDLASATTRPSGPFTSYVSKDGSVYNVGDTIILGVPSSNKTFAFITQGDVLSALNGTEPIHASAVVSRTKTEIKKIWITGNKRSGYMIMLRAKAPLLVYSIVNFETAIELGEIMSKKDINNSSSDKALGQLKKEKDKLDLGLITQQQYDSIKIELKKLIK